MSKEVTREEMLDWFDGYGRDEYRPRSPMRSGPYNEEMREAIRSLIESGKPKVSREFVYRHINQLKKIVTGYYPQGQPFTFLKNMLAKAGVGVEGGVMSNFPNQEKVTKQEMGKWLDAVKEMAELEVVLNWRKGDEVMFQAIRALIEDYPALKAEYDELRREVEGRR